MYTLETVAEDFKKNYLPQACSECDAFCCRLPQEELTDKEVLLLANIRHIDEVDSVRRADGASLFVKEERGWAMDLRESSSTGRIRKLDYPDVCPRLDGTSCSVYDHPDRPFGCSEFPLYFGKLEDRGRTVDAIVLHHQCKGISQDIAQEILSRALFEGYRVFLDPGLRHEVNFENIDDYVARFFKK
ncbi:hypothetical protein D6774_02075 [Candidatus Woesearchaeota archaeon]|nr:MAG: hypothetical protein D6774_02075 [Candidatus Woesearchaeota archaeon]